MTDRATFAVEWRQDHNIPKLYLGKIKIGYCVPFLGEWRAVISGHYKLHQHFSTLDEAKAALLRALGGTPC